MATETLNGRRERAGEVTLAALARITNLGTARPQRPMTDAERYALDNAPDSVFAGLGPCRCHACERHRAATGAA